MDNAVQKTLLKLLNLVLQALDSNSSCRISKEADQYRINVDTKSPELFNDVNGGLIQAMQHYLRIVIHKEYPEDKTHFLIDINGSRTSKEIKLKQELPQMVKEKVLGDGKTIVLVNLNGYERLIVHQLFSESKGLSTSSVGLGEKRKLLIMPTSEAGYSGMDDSIVWDINKI